MSQLIVILIISAVFDLSLSLHGFLIITTVLIFFAYFQWQFNRLLKWMREGARGYPPDLPEPLDDLTRLIWQQKIQSKKRKRKIQEYLGVFRDLAESIPDAAFLVDESGYLLNFNRQAQAILGLEKYRDIGRQIDHIIRSEGQLSIWSALKDNETLVVPLVTNEEIRLAFHRIPLRKGNVLLVARDVTETLNLEARRKAFIDNASHELKTPITVIRGFLEVMRNDDTLPLRWRSPIAEMYKHSEQMRELVEDMLRLAMLEMPEVDLHETDIALKPFVNGLIEEMNRDYPDTIGAVSGYVEPLLIRADESVLCTVLRNLLQNALLHSRSKHFVEVNVARTDEWLVMSVSDDGIGIAPSHLSRITERFYRVDKNRMTAKGSGLGLSIVKHGVEAHGGELEITSELGEGATFSLKLPLARVVRED